MNAFDYFFEKTADLDKAFLAGKEEISFRQLHKSSLGLASWLENKVGRNKHIILISVNNLFFVTSYLATTKMALIRKYLHSPGSEYRKRKFQLHK